MILLKSFAEQRGERTDTIRKYINRHQKEFAGHYKVIGKGMELDDYAAEKLGEVYKLPQPVQVVEDFETIKELAACRLELAEAYKKLSESSFLLAQAEAVKLLLEDRENQLAEEKERSRELQEALDAERAKTWWQKLRGK